MRQNTNTVCASRSYDAVIVGSGPNGLAAAVTLARAGRSVLVIEAEETIGGATRSAALTLPGFTHDLGSAIHPMGVGSPFFSTLPLADYGLQWIYPPASVAHPLDGGDAVLVQRSIGATGAQLGPDARRYWHIIAPLVRNWERIARFVLGPMRFPRNPVVMARFGLRAIWPATLFARTVFRSERTRAMFAGQAAHAILPLSMPATAAFGLLFCAMSHAVGWPFPRGGAQQISSALVGYLRTLGGEIITGQRVSALDELPAARTVLLDVTPRQFLRMAGPALPEGYRRALERFRYGPAIHKLDFALDGPIPWESPLCAQSATVHIGGTMDEIAESERDAWEGRHSERPFVLLAQHTLFDPSRAPDGQHTVWAYCHLPHGSNVDMSAQIEAQIERFAPGFRNRIIGRNSMGPTDLQRINANHIGGDINGGAQDVLQLFTRPVPRIDPYSTPLPGVYLCSSSTPPGGGVHGMCGYHAGRSALRFLARSR